MIRFIKLTLLFAIISLNISAQKNNIVFDNSTPRRTVKSHLSFLSNENFNPKIAAYTLAGDKYTPQQKQALSVKLKDIILKHGIDLTDIPDKRGGFLRQKKFILFDDLPQIYLVRIHKKWLYSEETVDNINKIYKTYYLKKNKKYSAKNGEHTDSVSTNTVNNSVINIPDTVTKIKFSLATPYNTILSHLVFLSDSLYNPELSAKTIHFTGADTARAIELAIKLKQIFLGAEFQVFDINDISKDTNFVDTLSGKHIYYPNPELKELYLEKVGDKWLYSTVTSKLIASVHKDMYSDDAEEIFSLSDRFIALAGNKSDAVLGIALWQWYMLLFFVIVGFIILGINFIIKKLIYRYYTKNRYKHQIAGIIKMLSMIIYLHIVKEYIPAIQFGVEYSHILYKTVKILIIYKSGILSFHIINTVKLYFTKEDKKKSVQGIVIFVTLILKTIAVIVIVLMSIQALGYSLVNVLAGLSIGGFAIALGAQDTIKNFFGSILIFSDHPFKVGDYIKHQNISGTVEEVGLRTTKIRTPHNSVVTIPNSKLSDSDIDNLGRRQYRRFKTYFVIDYKTPTEKIDELVNRIEKAIQENPDTRKDFYIVKMDDFSDVGIKILLYVFFLVDNLKDEARCKHTIIKDVLNIAQDLDIKFPVRNFSIPDNENG